MFVPKSVWPPRQEDLDDRLHIAHDARRCDSRAYRGQARKVPHRFCRVMGNARSCKRPKALRSSKNSLPRKCEKLWATFEPPVLALGQVQLKRPSSSAIAFSRGERESKAP